MKPLDVLCDAQKFDLFQLCRLLEDRLAGGEERRVRFRAAFGLGFPAADVAAIELASRGAAPRAFITAHGVALGGASSPLPGHYADVWSAGDGATDRAAALLDVLHDRLLGLHYYAWRAVQATGCAEAPTGEALRKSSTRGSAEHRLARALGVPIRVIPNIRREVILPPAHRFYLGKDTARLGQALRLGRRVSDARGKCRLVLGPCAKRDLDGWMDAEKRVVFDRHVRLALEAPLDYDVEIRFGADLGPLALAYKGAPNCAQLGRTTFLGPRLPSCPVAFPRIGGVS